MVEAEITQHLGDLVKFICVCGEECAIVWDGLDEVCSKCGRRWTMEIKTKIKEVV